MIIFMIIFVLLLLTACYKMEYRIVNLIELTLDNNQISIVPSEIKNVLNNCRIKI
jgi:hypothetical protein